MKEINYVNLTNGIEAIPKLKGNFRFIRIQSTFCEQHLWNRLLQDLDNDFLFNLALGNSVTIYDYGAGKPNSRALYQGVEFIRYVLTRRWLGSEIRPNVDRTGNKDPGKDCRAYFSECYARLSRRTKKKLDYFKPFLLTDRIAIKTVCSATYHDGDREFYRNILAREVRPELASTESR